MYRAALFDLDGTLTESGPGITRSVAYSLQKFGITETDQKKLDRFVGPPLIDSYMRYYDLSYDQAKQAVVFYREYYETKGLFENRVYDGVEEMLRTLRDGGVRCVVATSKPKQFAVLILEHFGLEDYFSRVAGASMDESRTDKGEVIAYALEKAGIAPGERTIMVGDREHDVLGAKRNGLPTVGVLYGYGSREELTAAGAAFLAETPDQAASYILNH